MACLTSAIEPLRAANEICGEQVFSWKVISETDISVRSSARVSFEADMPLRDLKQVTALYILAPPLARFEEKKLTPAKIRWLNSHGVTLGAFSGGVFPLARSGVLGTRICSVHWVYRAAFEEEFSNVLVSDKVITIDRGIETVSGAGAVFDFMLGKIQNVLGAAVGTEVACWFQHPYIRREDVAQRIPVPETNVAADQLTNHVGLAVKIFSENVEVLVSIADVAAEIGVSTRQLDRVFARETGMSPLKYYRRLRMEKARQLVQYSDMPMKSIASAVGYLTVAKFSRYYVGAFRIDPELDRKSTNSFRVHKNAPLPTI